MVHPRDKIGHSVPIQELFDLVVGGIIALGIFKKGWSINEAIDNFEMLVRDAFLKRFPLRWIENIPGAHLGAQLMCTYIYQSDGIETALKTAFSKHSRLFGDIVLDKPELSKIALVATSQEEERPILLTNYNREWRVNGDEQQPTPRREAKKRTKDLGDKSARCTSAAPTYFQPYKHNATHRIYIDGGMEKNNPVSIADSERRFIWPNKSANSRDIVVSVATGYQTDFNGESSNKVLLSQMLKPLERLGIVAKIATLRLVLHNTINCQKMWNEYRHSLGPDDSLVSECHRVKVPYGPGQDLGSLDGVSKMSSMKNEALRFLEQEKRSVSLKIQKDSAQKIELIARQLVASLFYFQMTTIDHLNDEDDYCYGLIRCRLSSSCTVQMESLMQASPSFRLYEGVGGDPTPVKLDDRGWNLGSFSIMAEFRMLKTSSKFRIRMSFGSNWDDISGFPRNLRTTRGKPVA